VIAGTSINKQLGFKVEILIYGPRILLGRHIRSELYFRVLSAMELANEAPEIYFHEVSDTRGLEYVEAL
jgi:hypothetical protein